MIIEYRLEKFVGQCRLGIVNFVNVRIYSTFAEIRVPADNTVIIV